LPSRRRTTPADPPLPSFELLRVADLHASYDGQVDVLRGVSIDVHEHEIVTILGSNGAGKTTLVAAVAGLVPHVRGSIRFQGEELAGLPPHGIVARGVVEVPTGREVFPDQTVTENLLLGAHAYRSDRARVRRNLADMLDRFPVLGRRASQPAGTLSGGEQQILSIARGLMGRPRLMILDEPSMGLAPILVTQVFDLLKEIWREGTTLLLIEKLAHLAISFSHRLYVLELGSLVTEGTAEELAGDPRVEEAYLGRRAWVAELADDAETAEPGPTAASRTRRKGQRTP
jgi:branched-chain amino acid transport system ATP-binding protein